MQVYTLTAFTVRGSVHASVYVNCLHCQRIGPCKCICLLPSLTEDRSMQVYMLTAFTVRGSVYASVYVNCLHCQRIGPCKCIC